MAQTANRHLKLWFAGQAGNWQLAAYELDELKEGFEDAAKFHPTHKSVKTPLPQLIARTMNPPLEELERAVQRKNLDEFNRSYDALTTSCNGCHQLSGFGFNVVTRPTGNPFTNQSFAYPD